MLRPVSPSRRRGRSGGTGSWISIARGLIIAVWATIVVARVVAVSIDPHIDLTVFVAVEVGAAIIGVCVVLAGALRGRMWARRRVDETLARTIRRVDPTAWTVPAIPTREQVEAIHADAPGVPVARRVTWSFGAIEASLWQSDGTRAVRLLVIPWRAVVHVGVEELAPLRRDGRFAAIALHYVRADDAGAVASFFVRRSVGAMRILNRGTGLDKVVAALVAERGAS